ncbi:MAG TPA: SRPBCC family protein, partial [Thermomicrobiales bacterium]|nr:SRPBCC family protein [Thermomicrobiales bacterium]
MQASRPESDRNGHVQVEGEMERLARALGWFSLGLGFAQIAAPSKMARLVGVADDDETIALMRVLGVREIASGLGILTQQKPTPWMWTRVGGDAMDLALLRRALSSPRADHNRVAAATAAVAGIAAVDALCSTRLTAETNAPGQTEATSQSGEVHATAAITVNAPLAEVYAFWEDFRNLPRFMGDFASVEVSGDRTSRWSLTAPAGITFDWDVEIVDATPNQRIAWQ